MLVDLFVKMLSSHVELHWPLVMMIYELLHDKVMRIMIVMIPVTSSLVVFGID